MVALPQAHSHSHHDPQSAEIALQRAHQRIRELEEELAWIDKVSANSDLSPAEKLTFIYTKRAVKKAKPDERGLHKIWIDGIKKDNALSAATVGKNIQELAKLGAFTRHEERDPTTGIKRVLLGLTDLVDTPNLIKREVPRNHGGKRTSCSACGSENLIIEERVICADCGTVHKERKRPYNRPEGNSEDTPNLQDESWGTEQQHPPTEKYSDSYPLTTHKYYEASALLPMVNTVKTLNDWLVCGDGGTQQIIVATGKVDASDKYISKPPGTKPDLQKYRYGHRDHIYGSNPIQKDGSTWLLEFDFDNQTPEDAVHDASVLEYMATLAAGGVSSLYFPRRPGRGHYLIKFSERVHPEAAYHAVIRLCPALASVKECYPTHVGEKQRQRISWPFYQRIGDEVSECRVLAMLPYRPDQLITSAGVKSDPHGLASLLAVALTPASIIEECDYPLPEPEPQEQPVEQNAGNGGVLLEKPSPQHTCSSDDTDLSKIVIAEFNRQHTWEQIAPDIRNNRFIASWHDERTASVVIDADGQYACDHGQRRPGQPKKIDKYEAWLLLNHIDKKSDLAARCAAYRGIQGHGHERICEV